MRERQGLRAVAAAAAALLIGGDVAAFGPGALLNVGRWLFPYLALFLAIDLFRARRALGDREAFLLGGAAGLLHDGAWAKLLQEGTLLLGVDWVNALSTALEWGLISVAALHWAAAVDLKPARGARWEKAALAVIGVLAFAGYLIDLRLGDTLAARAIGPTWLLADLLFLGAAAALVWQAWRHSGHARRERWLILLAGFAAWLPTAQFIARLGDWPSPWVLLLLVAWTFGFVWYARRLWHRRGWEHGEPRRSYYPLLALAGGRLAGALLIWLSYEGDPRAGFAFSFVVDLPSKLVFFHSFLSTRVEV